MEKLTKFVYFVKTEVDLLQCHRKPKHDKPNTSETRYTSQRIFMDKKKRESILRWNYANDKYHLNSNVSQKCIYIPKIHEVLYLLKNN